MVCCLELLFHDENEDTYITHHTRVYSYTQTFERFFVKYSTFNNAICDLFFEYIRFYEFSKIDYFYYSSIYAIFICFVFIYSFSLLLNEVSYI